MSENCPLCGHSITAEQKPIERDLDGIPLAASIMPGLGIPWADPQSLRYKVFLGGQELSGCVGFDRMQNVAWRYSVDEGGRYIIKNGEFRVEQVSGEVTVKPVE